MGTAWLCRPWALPPSLPPSPQSGTIREPLYLASFCPSGLSSGLLLFGPPRRASPGPRCHRLLCPLCISAATALLLLTSVSDIHAGLCAVYMPSAQLSVRAHRSSQGWPRAPRVPINAHEERMGGGRDRTGQQALVLRLFPHRSALPASSSETTRVVGEVGGVGTQGSVQG